MALQFPQESFIRIVENSNKSSFKLTGSSLINSLASTPQMSMEKKKLTVLQEVSVPGIIDSNEEVPQLPTLYGNDKMKGYS